MSINTTSESGLLFGTVEAKQTDILTLTLSCDLHTTNTPKNVVAAILLAELLKSGAGKLSRNDFSHALSLLGATIETNLERGVLTINLTATAPVAKRSLQLLSLMITKPTFAKNEYRRAVRTLRNQLHAYEENARARAHDALTRSIFKPEDRHYVHDIPSLSESLSRVSLSRIKQLHKGFYTSLWTVTAVGNHTSVTQAKRAIRRLRRTVTIKPFSHSLSKTQTTSNRFVLISVPSKQNVEVSIGGSVSLTKSDIDFPAFLFGLAVLGKSGGFSGRLMSTVREKEGLTYGIYARTEGVSAQESGYWRISTFFAPEDLERGLTSTFREIRLIHEKGITADEWRRFTTILRTNTDLIFDSLTATGQLVHQQLTTGFLWTDYEAFRERMLSVTKKEVNEALSKHINPDTLTISLAGPISDKKISLSALTAKL